MRFVGPKVFSRSLRDKNVYYQIADLGSSLDEGVSLEIHGERRIIIFFALN